MSTNMSEDESHRLPNDFNINVTIPILSEQLKKVPLKEYFHNLILRMEEERARARKDGRT
jgi:hypothetical protein